MKIELGEITIDVTHKDIKNVHLSVNPPFGDVRISAPLNMSVHALRAFAISKLPWIKETLPLKRRELTMKRTDSLFTIRMMIF